MDFKEYLNNLLEESAGDAIDKIAKLTDRNDHSGARILGAQYLKNKKLERIFTAIKDIHLVERSLPPQIKDYRYEKYKEMMKYAKSKLDKETYERFSGAF